MCEEKMNLQPALVEMKLMYPSVSALTMYFNTKHADFHSNH